MKKLKNFRVKFLLAPGLCGFLLHGVEAIGAGAAPPGASRMPASQSPGNTPKSQVPQSPSVPPKVQAPQPHGVTPKASQEQPGMAAPQPSFESSPSPPRSSPNVTPQGPSRKEPKKVRRYIESYEEFGPYDIEPITREEAGSGVSVHRAQEGLDRPYGAQFMLASNLGAFNRNLKVGDEEKKDQYRNGHIEAEISMFLRSFQVGVDIESGLENMPLSGTSVEVHRLSAGPVFKYNFRSIDRSLVVPFLVLGGGYASESIKGEGMEETRGEGGLGRIGMGIHLFLSSHVALSPRVEALGTSIKVRGGLNGQKSDIGGRFFFGLSVFL